MSLNAFYLIDNTILIGYLDLKIWKKLSILKKLKVYRLTIKYRDHDIVLHVQTYVISS